MNHRVYDMLQNAELPTEGMILRDPTDNGFMLGWGKTVGNSVQGWAKGAIFRHSDGSSATTLLYINTGTVTTAVWSYLTAT